MVVGSFKLGSSSASVAKTLADEDGNKSPIFFQ